MSWLNKISNRITAHVAPARSTNASRPAGDDAPNLKPSGKPPGKLASFRGAITGLAKKGGKRTPRHADLRAPSMSHLSQQAISADQTLKARSVAAHDILQDIVRAARSTDVQELAVGLEVGEPTARAVIGLAQTLAANSVRFEVARGAITPADPSPAHSHFSAGIHAAGTLLDRCIDKLGMSEEQATQVLQARQRGLSEDEAIARITGNANGQPMPGPSMNEPLA
jgi:hypothetical protein